MKTHLVIGDTHAHPNHNNNRAEWLGKLIVDVKPDTVIHIGDSADMPSLSAYDRGKKSFQGRTYQKDINAHLDFQDRLWSTAAKGYNKKKLPRRVFCLGNHEERINRAIEISPELDGAIGYKDLRLQDWYDDICWYEGNTPGVIEVDGIYYAHYFVSGLKGLPLGGEHPADTLVAKKFVSATAGHNHLADWAVRTGADGRQRMGAFAGCYVDYITDWAGCSNNLWWKGILVKRNIESGVYDPEFISLKAIKREYE